MKHLLLLALVSLTASLAHSQLAIKARTLYPMTGDFTPIADGVVLCGADGKIQAVGPAVTTPIPAGWKTVEAIVAIPGLVDARATVGMSGILNWDKRDQEQLETSAPIQPELRAVDAYNGRDPLVEWVRELGVTTVHTGHTHGTLVSGQTMIVKTNVPSVTGAKDVLNGFAGVAASLGGASFSGKSPGTRAKSVAMLRAALIKAREYQSKHEKAEADKKPDRDLHMETLGAVLKREVPLFLTADRHQDISAALRLKEEFQFNLILDSAAESYLLLDEIKAAKVPIIVHPPMARAVGDRENLTFTLAGKLHKAAIPFAFQSGYEGYVPKTRVVLFEAAMAAAHGLPKEQALAGCTIHAAVILGIDKRVGSLDTGKDADVALYDGDPLETTTHCTAVIIDGKVVSDKSR